VTQRLPRLRSSVALVLVVAFAAVACGGGINNANLRMAPVEENAAVGPGDLFGMQILGEAGIPADYLVSKDGTAMFPFLKRVKVEGLEPEEIEELIRNKLIEGKFLSDPIVIVRVKAYNSKIITILGMVGRSGRYPFSNGMTMIGAISMAGGFNSIARRGQVSIKRKLKDKEGKTSTRTFIVNVESIIEGDANDIPLQAGDQIYVPERIF
jgi:protein involved in polysaccharide export with SLBB domain